MDKHNHTSAKYKEQGKKYAVAKSFSEFSIRICHGEQKIKNFKKLKVEGLKVWCGESQWRCEAPNWKRQELVVKDTKCQAKASWQRQ